MMALTRDVKVAIRERVARDSAFREALLQEGVQCLLAGDVDTGKAVLRDYINATIGFVELGRMTGKSPKSLMRMLGPGGNPQARNLFAVIAALQRDAAVEMEVRAPPRSLARNDRTGRRS
jgi:DNA-binding phage protein